jgi:GNAT superfamily N-acetyltransferase
LHQDESLIYTLLTPERSDEALAVISEGFADEPGSILIESDRTERLRQASIFASFFARDCASNGMSIVCIDSSNGSVAGVFWTRDLMIHLPEDFDVSNLHCIAPSLGVLEKLEADYFKVRPGIAVGDCMDLWMLGVHPGYRKRGIAATLTTTALQWVATKGYKYIILESSGGYSAKCAASAGMRSVVRKVYSEEEPLLRGMREEHAVMQLWEWEAKERGH